MMDSDKLAYFISKYRNTDEDELRDLATRAASLADEAHEALLQVLRERGISATAQALRAEDFTDRSATPWQPVPESKANGRLLRAIPVALILVAGVIVSQVLGFSSSAGVLNAKSLVSALFIGAISFPIALGLSWLVVKPSKPKRFPSTMQTGEHSNATLKSHVPSASDRLSKWNYVAAALGLSAILGLFIPKLLAGSLQGRDFVGLAFWLVVLAISGKNIFDKLRTKRK